MIIETLITAIVDLLVSDSLQSGTKKLRRALGRDPQHAALRRALGRAVDQFKYAHPEVAASLLDEHFISHGALPVLARFVRRPRVSKSVAQDLARAFSRQLGSNIVLPKQIDMLAISHDFLTYLAKDLAAEPTYRDLFTSLDLVDVRRASVRTARSVEELHSDVRKIGDNVGEIAELIACALGSADAPNLPLSMGISPTMAATLGVEAREASTDERKQLQEARRVAKLQAKQRRAARKVEQQADRLALPQSA